MSLISFTARLEGSGAPAIDIDLTSWSLFAPSKRLVVRMATRSGHAFDLRASGSKLLELMMKCFEFAQSFIASRPFG